MRGFLYTIDKTSEYAGKAVWFLVIVVTVVLLREVIARYIFNSPSIWAYEVSQQLCAMYYLIGGAYCLRYKGHIAVDILKNRFSIRGRAILDIITSTFFFCFVIVLVWKGMELGIHSAQVHEATNPPWRGPLWPTKLVLPIGAILLAVQGVATLIRNVMTALRGTPYEH